MHYTERIIQFLFDIRVRRSITQKKNNRLFWDVEMASGLSQKPTPVIWSSFDGTNFGTCFMLSCQPQYTRIEMLNWTPLRSLGMRLSSLWNPKAPKDPNQQMLEQMEKVEGRKCPSQSTGVAEYPRQSTSSPLSTIPTDQQYHGTHGCPFAIWWSWGPYCCRFVSNTGLLYCS